MSHQTKYVQIHCIKAALINIFILAMDQTHVCDFVERGHLMNRQNYQVK